MSRHHNPIPKVDFLLYREYVLLVILRSNPFKGYLCLPCGFKYEKQKVEKAIKSEVGRTNFGGRANQDLSRVLRTAKRSNGDNLTIVFKVLY